MQEIRGRPYAELGRYYPGNPFFMRGADKALLNMVVIGSIVDATTVIPTDESVGTSIARLLFDQPEALYGHGIVPRAL